MSVFAASPQVVSRLKLEGFTHWQEEQINSVLHQIPDALLANFNRIVADPSLGAKHGRYEPSAHVIHLNPRDFSNRTKFGHGPGRKLPHVDLTLAHEIGHGVWFQLSDADRKAWQRISGWKLGSGQNQAPPYRERRSGWPKETSDETHKEGIGFTRHYGERGEQEDFADCFGFYILGQKERVPEAKSVFLARVLRKF